MSRTWFTSTALAVVVLLVAVGCQTSPNTAASAAGATAPPAGTSSASASATTAPAPSSPSSGASATASASAGASSPELCLEDSVKDAWHNIGTHTADAPTRSAAADSLEELELDRRDDELRDNLVAALRSDPFDQNALALAAVAWEGSVALPTC